MFTFTMNGCKRLCYLKILALLVIQDVEYRRKAFKVEFNVIFKLDKRRKEIRRIGVAHRYLWSLDGYPLPVPI